MNPHQIKTILIAYGLILNEFTLGELNDALCILKRQKATSPDDINNEMILLLNSLNNNIS